MTIQDMSGSVLQNTDEDSLLSAPKELEKLVSRQFYVSGSELSKDTLEHCRQGLLHLTGIDHLDINADGIMIRYDFVLHSYCEIWDTLTGLGYHQKTGFFHLLKRFWISLSEDNRRDVLLRPSVWLMHLQALYIHFDR